MQSQASKIVLAVIITAVVVGGGTYHWQTQKTTKSIISETSESDFALSIEQEPLGPSVVKLRDTYNEGAGFSIRFPSSWGLVSVKKHNLTDSGGVATELPQRASYTFASEFRPSIHFFTIVISYAKDKTHSLVTQGNRQYIAEDATYYYNYNPSTDYCIEQGTCRESEVETINQEIKKIIDSFELL